MDNKKRLYEILMTDNVVDSINNNMNFLFKIIPEIKHAIYFDQKNPQHHLDVWNHTLLALSKSKQNFDVRLTLLLHDIGKPFSYQDGNDGIRHFKGHPDKSCDITNNILKKLGYDIDFILKICYLVKYHDEPITLSEIEDDINLQKERFEVQRCDALAHHPDHLEKRIKYINEIETLIKNESEKN